MSAYMSICYEDRIELLTDGAVYTPDGVLVETAEKVRRSSRWPLAITGRGSSAIVDILASYIETLGEMSATVNEVISRLQIWLDGRKLKGSPEPFEILIAAFVDDAGPVNLYFSSERMIDGVEPWVIHTMGTEFGGGPAFSLDELRAAGISIESLSAGLEEAGADLMEMMRHRKGGNPAAPHLSEVYGIGGHVDLTVIRLDGVTTKRLRTWPDVIGEKIDPFREEAAAA
ncbi:hypothetical protein [Neorhizobium huautlense]|uniref:hypothetical protein n=1 Tax=Neorhizobium huautlense TaxID=67774 RepID=UPI000CF8D607|nr:hypothetical protein [Neorhizobium huautlense]